MGRSQKVATLFAVCMATGALAAPAASAASSSPLGPIASLVSSVTPKIQQVTDQICLYTPSQTLALTSPVKAGDALILVVAGQGYSATSPSVTGVSDNVNGAWTQLTNAPAVQSQLPDQLRYLSYSVYEIKHSLAAPNGLTVTVNETAGQSAASAVAFEVNGSVVSSAFNDSSLTYTTNGVMSAPTASSFGNPLDLTVGLFGAYYYGQSFNAGSGWTISTATNCTAAIEISGGPTGGFNWNGSGAVPVPTVGVNEPTDYMAGTLNFGFDLQAFLDRYPQLSALLAKNPQLMTALENLENDS